MRLKRQACGSDRPLDLSEKGVLGTAAIIMRNVKNQVLETQYAIEQDTGSCGL